MTVVKLQKCEIKMLSFSVKEMEYEIKTLSCSWTKEVLEFLNRVEVPFFGRRVDRNHRIRLAAQCELKQLASLGVEPRSRYGKRMFAVIKYLDNDFDRDDDILVKYIENDRDAETDVDEETAYTVWEACSNPKYASALPRTKDLPPDIREWMKFNLPILPMKRRRKD